MTRRLGLFVGLLGLALTASAQPQQAPATKPPAKAKAKRVFTEDDLQGFRKPWDEYADQKRAAEQAQAQAAASPAKSAQSEPGAPPTDSKSATRIDEPDSPKAIARELAKWEDELKRNEKLAEEARQEMAQATNPDRAELAKAKLDIYEQNVVDLKQRVAQTRTQLDEAQKKSKAGPAATSPEAGAGNQQPPR